MSNRIYKLRFVYLKSIFNSGDNMVNKTIVPFNDKKGGTYELNIDLDKLSKGEMLNTIIGIGRVNQQSTFVSKINKAKKPGEVPSLIETFKSTTERDLITYMAQNL